MHDDSMYSVGGVIKRARGHTKVALKMWWTHEVELGVRVEELRVQWGVREGIYTYKRVWLWPAGQ